MNLFLRKEKIDVLSMANVIRQLTKINISNVENIFDQAGVIYNHVNCQLVIMTLNHEYLRYFLYKNNNNKLIDQSVEISYDLFFRSLSLDNKTINEYHTIINSAKQDFVKVFSKRYLKKEDKFNLLYQYFLNSLDINERLIDSIKKQEIIIIFKYWFNYFVKKTVIYKVVESEESNIMPIDIDF